MVPPCVIQSESYLCANKITKTFHTSLCHGATILDLESRRPLCFSRRKAFAHHQSMSRTRWSVIPLARSLVAPGQNGRDNRPLWMAESSWNPERSPSLGVSFPPSYPKEPRNPSYNFLHTRARLEICLAKIPSLLISLFHPNF